MQSCEYTQFTFYVKTTYVKNPPHSTMFNKKLVNARTPILQYSSTDLCPLFKVCDQGFKMRLEFRLTYVDSVSNPLEINLLIK